MSNEYEDSSESGLQMLRSLLPFEAMSLAFPESQAASRTGLSKETAAKISSWLASATDHATSIMWLTGLPDRSSVGGVVELCQSAHQFAAAYSFSSRRGTQQKLELIPCLAYQIAMNVPSLRFSIGLAMFQEPDVLSQSVADQLVSLLLLPFDEVDPTTMHNCRLVVIIDSIELYFDADAQEVMISAIELAVTSQRLPLRFIFTSQHKMDYAAPPLHHDTHIHIHNSLSSSNNQNSMPLQVSPSPRGKSSACHSRGFPKFVQTQYSVGGAESYSRSMMMLGHGMALWSPEGYLDRPYPHVQNGVSIGDVMFITSPGKYEYMFNIFHDDNDPIQSRHLAFGHFKPIHPPLDSTEVTYSEHYFPPGTVITSPGVSVTTVENSRMNFIFESKQQEGAALILPEGGSREDLVSTQRFHEYVKRWASYWYNLRAIANGSLFLVTGCDKASDYAAMCFPSVRPSTKDASYRIKMEYIPQENIDRDPWYTRYGDPIGKRHYADDCSLASGEPWPQGGRPLCVFVRGMRIVLSQSTRSGAIGLKDIYEKRYYTTVLHRTPSLDHVTTSVLACFRRRLSELTALSKLPRVCKQAAHPVFLIGPILLEMHPSAMVALVNDATWCSFVNKTETGTLDALESLTHRVLEQCSITCQDGIILLNRKTVVPGLEHVSLPITKRNRNSVWHGKPVGISQYATKLLGVPSRKEPPREYFNNLPRA